MDAVKNIKRAIEIAGGQSALARLISEKRRREKRKGVRQSHVWTWLNRDKKVPPEFCPDIESVTNGVIRCEDLCPDVDWSVLRGTGYQSTHQDAAGGEAA